MNDSACWNDDSEKKQKKEVSTENEKQVAAGPRVKATTATTSTEKKNTARDGHANKR